MNEWFPLGVVPRMFDITKEFFKLPFHVRLQIMNSLGAPVEDETFRRGSQVSTREESAL